MSRPRNEPLERAAPVPLPDEPAVARASLRISPGVVIPAAELSFSAVRSSGPGGQNVNRVATKVELRYDLPRSRALSAAVKARLTKLAAGRLDAEGRVVVVSQATRQQGRNLEDARDKLAALVRQALVEPKPRKPTRPSRGARERRLADKRRVAEQKHLRPGGGD